MQTKHLIHFLSASLCFCTLSSNGCARRTDDSVVTTPTTAVADPAAPVKPDKSADERTDPAAAPNVADASWSDIKEYGFPMRVQFFIGFERLESKVDMQLRELIAKRATMKGNTDTKEWDFSMKEMNDARSYLKSMGEELSKADREMWEQKKEKVGQAWVRTQDAYSKVKASTTI